MSDVTAPQPHPAPPPAARPAERRGLAVASLVLGGLALLGCWIPVLNAVSIVLALVGLGLGVPALVKAARGTGGGRVLALVGVVLSVLAILAAVLVNVLFGAAFRGFVGDVQRSVAEGSTPSPAPAPAEPGDPADPLEPAPAPPPAPAGALALGQSTQVGDYTVAVTGVDQDGDEEVAAVEYSEPPTGRYVLVDLAVTYQGDAEGTAWIDLTTEYQGTDARNYSSDSCSGYLPDSGFDQPSLRAGGTAAYTVCFDLPPEAVAGGQVSVSSLADFDAPPVLWNAQ